MRRYTYKQASEPVVSNKVEPDTYHSSFRLYKTLRCLECAYCIWIFMLVWISSSHFSSIAQQRQQEQQLAIAASWCWWWLEKGGVVADGQPTQLCMCTYIYEDTRMWICSSWVRDGHITGRDVHLQNCISVIKWIHVF